MSYYDIIHQLSITMQEKLSETQLIDSQYTQLTERFWINRYTILGSGTFGQVFMGYDIQSHRYIAVKFIPKQKITVNALSNEMQEVKIMKSLNHCNIMKFYGSQNMQDGTYMFLQLCKKGPLSDRITQGLTQQQTINLFKQLVHGMIYLNSQSIFHRDLKPDNLLLTTQGQLKIADFGIARDIDQLDKMTFMKCTAAYAAPQVYLLQDYQALEGKYTQTCDVFSAGYILYEMLTRQQLNKAVGTHAGLRAMLRSAKNQGGFQLNHPALTPRWSDLLKKMLQFDPLNRPSFQEIQKILQEFSQGHKEIPITRQILQADEQQSKKILDSYMRQLNHQIKLANYLINPLKIISKYSNKQSRLLPKVYKLSILYYSLMLYCCRADQGISLLGDKQKVILQGFTLPLRQLQFLMTNQHKQAYLAFDSGNIVKFNQGKQQILKYLSQNIIPKLLQIVQSDKKGQKHNKVILQQLKIMNRINRFKQNGDSSRFADVVKNQFNRILINLKQDVQNLVKYSKEDLIMYLVVIFTFNLQQCHTPDQLFSSLEEIEKMNIQQLIKNIEKINK